MKTCKSLLIMMALFSPLTQAKPINITTDSTTYSNTSNDSIAANTTNALQCVVRSSLTLEEATKTRRSIQALTPVTYKRLINLSLKLTPPKKRKERRDTIKQEARQNTTLTTKKYKKLYLSTSAKLHKSIELVKPNPQLSISEFMWNFIYTQESISASYHQQAKKKIETLKSSFHRHVQHIMEKNYSLKQKPKMTPFMSAVFANAGLDENYDNATMITAGTANVNNFFYAHQNKPFTFCLTFAYEQRKPNRNFQYSVIFDGDEVTVFNPIYMPAPYSMSLIEFNLQFINEFNRALYKDDGTEQIRYIHFRPDTLN